MLSLFPPISKRFTGKCLVCELCSLCGFVCGGACQRVCEKDGIVKQKHSSPEPYMSDIFPSQPDS